MYIHLLELLLDWWLPPRETARWVGATKGAPAALGARTAPSWIHDPSLPLHAPSILSLLPYRDPLVQACILEGKFRANADAHAVLGAYLRHLLTHVADEFALAPLPVIVVPIPLSAARHRTRGFNQSERYAAPACGPPSWLFLDTTLLARARDTPPQTTLSGRARRHNLENAFVARRPADPHATYILFDDVVTTGTTLSAASRALHAAGARHVFPLALAY